MLMMAVLSITMFLGITLLAQAYHVIPSEHETVVSQLARGVFGDRGVAVLRGPGGDDADPRAGGEHRLCGLSRGWRRFSRAIGYLPRQFMNQGDRLAFSNGIVGLSVFAAILLVVFGGDTHALIPLYMIGVFVSFTLSQAGMVVHWRRLRGRRVADAARLINGVGALVTGVVLIVVAVTKAHEGAWIIMLLIPLNVLVLPRHAQALRRRGGAAVAAGLAAASAAGTTPSSCRSAASSARSSRRWTTRRRCRATCARVYVEHRSGRDRAAEKRVGASGATACRWSCCESPYRSLMEPLLEYIEQLNRDIPDDYVTVVLPEFVPARWWHHLFHNQRALLIKGALLFKPNTVVTSVPFHLSH